MQNQQATLAQLLARSANADFGPFKNVYGRALIVIIDVTAVAATPSVVFTIRGVDRLSGKKWDILASAAIIGTGTTVLRVSPELTSAANLIAKDLAPEEFEVHAEHADADSITYSIGAHYLV